MLDELGEVGSRFDLRAGRSPDAPDTASFEGADATHGWVHSYETGTTVDGPGVRLVQARRQQRRMLASTAPMPSARLRAAVKPQRALRVGPRGGPGDGGRPRLVPRAARPLAGRGPQARRTTNPKGPNTSSKISGCPPK